MKTTSLRWWSSIPFILALIVLLFLGWCALQAFVYPYDGIIGFQPSGLVNEIDKFGPAFNRLKVGDQILTVDGKQIHDGFPLYQNKSGGDTAYFNVLRKGKVISISFALNNPSPKELAERLAPLLVALIFWLMGVGVQTFKPYWASWRIYFLFFMSSALMLAAGDVSYVSPPWVGSLFGILIWLIGPLSIHFHLNFPQTTTFRGQWFVLRALYIIAFFGSLPYLIWSSQAISLSTWFVYLTFVRALFLTINLLGVVSLLFYTYRHTITPGTRSKVRIVVLGGVIGAIPVVTLTILPQALTLQPIVPYGFALMILGIVPLTYGYAIFRHRLVEYEKHVNRGATYILVYSILGAFYMVLYAGIHRMISADSSSIETLLNTVLILVLATIFIPISRRVQRMVDTVFYGGWYDYRSAVRQITQGLEQITDLRELARTVGDRLVSTLRLQDTCVFLRDSSGNFSVIEVSPRDGLSENISANLPVLPMSSLQYLISMGETGGTSSMREALSGVSLSREEYQLLNSEQVHLWLPIIGHGQVQGYLALGPKFGGDIFSGEDLDILRVIAWQIAPVTENIHLLTQLREHAAELEERVRERTSELHEEKERVEAILASVGDGVIVTDLNGSIVTMNAAFEKQCGFSSSYLNGQKFYAQLAPYNDVGILDDMQATLKRGEDWNGELLYPRNGSKPYNIQLTIAPVYNQSDQMIGYVGSQRDITQERELNRLKDQFISDVSHELRTPATNLSLYLELMEHGPEIKRGDYLNILKGQTKLLVKLIEDILDLSRLEMGKSKKIRFAPVDLNLLTEQVVTALLPMAEASGLSLVFEPKTDLEVVYGEQNQLARVITNLVSNSIRYTLEGDVRIHTYNQDHHVCLEVSDTGIGIDPEDQPYLFDRFFRGRQVRQSKIHGTGLGLAIVKEIVDLHEGSIQLESEVGKGTTVQVWLPAYQEQT